MGKLIKITFLGDILCQREQISAVRRSRDGFGAIFDRVKHLWRDSDYVVANLETPVAGRALRHTYEAMRFNAPDDFLLAIKQSGINFVSTANNHALDRGVEGVNNTISKLEALGLDHDGTFSVKDASERLFVKSIHGVRVAFISCTYGTNQGLKCNYLPDEELWRVRILKRPEVMKTTRVFLLRRFISNLVPLVIKDFLRKRKVCKVHDAYVQDSVPANEIGKDENVRFERSVRDLVVKAKTMADIVVVLPHVGGQYCPEPGEYQLYTMKWLAEAGADLIVANHAHIPQHAIKYSNGALGVCALGDFTFVPVSNRQDRLSDRSIVMNVFIDSELKKVVNISYSVTKSVLNENQVSVVVEDDDMRNDVDVLMKDIT